jgi:dienelactone hydrolase
MATPVLTRFELVGADGGPLRGEVRAPGRNGARPAVVICHGFKGFKDWGSFPHLADRLARGGITAVSFNFSGSGVGPDGETFSEPERFGHATLGKDLEDLAGVLGALRGGTLVPGLAPPAAVGLFGHSRGGGIAILHTAHDSGVRALVTWSAVGAALRWGPETIAKWRREGRIDITNTRTGDVLPLYIDALDEIEADRAGRLDIGQAAAAVRAPWLIVHGAADESVPLKEGQFLWEQSARRAELLVVPHGSHTFGARHPWAGMTEELAQAMDATVSWFARSLF